MGAKIRRQERPKPELTDVVRELLPDDLQVQLADQRITVRRSPRKTAFAGLTIWELVKERWQGIRLVGDYRVVKQEVTAHTQPFDVYVDRRKVGRLDLHYERDTLTGLDCEVTFGCTNYRREIEGPAVLDYL